MQVRKIQVLLGAAVLVCTSALTARGQLVTDFTFDDQSIGSTPTTTTPGVDPQPQQHVYAIDGFPDTGPYSGSVTVNNAGTMSKAAVMTTTQGGTGSQYMDTQFLTNGPQITVDFDLDVIDVPTTGLPQSATSIPNGQAFVIQAFAESGGGNDRVWRFAASPTSATGGIFGMRDNSGGDIIPFATYNEGDTHHFKIVSDYSTDTVNVFMDGNPEVVGAPFVNAGATGMDELFIFQNDVEGQTNSVAIDNIVTAVPEPASISMLGLGALALARRKRKM
jgi:hypothetical protein